MGRVNKVLRRRRLTAILIDAGVVDLKVCNDVCEILCGFSIFPGEGATALPWDGEWLPSKGRSGECVYLITDGPRAKIGFSTNMPQRFQQIWQGTGRPVCLARAVYTPKAAKLERILHGILAAHHIQGEWFRITALEWDATLPQAFATLP